MMPFSSVAMIEKLALVRMAFCNAPALSNANALRASVARSPLAAASSPGGLPDCILNMTDSRIEQANAPRGLGVPRRQGATASPVGKVHALNKDTNSLRGARMCGKAHMERNGGNKGRGTVGLADRPSGAEPGKRPSSRQFVRQHKRGGARNVGKQPVE